MHLDLLAEAAPRVLAQVEQRFWSRLTADERNALSSISAKLMETEPPSR